MAKTNSKSPGTKDASTFDKLLSRIRKGKDFPTFYQNVVEINKTINSHYASAPEIANVILKDYALTKKLLTLVNSAFYGQSRRGVTTVSEAIVLVGINQVQMAIASLMFFEQMQQNARTTELKDTCIHAFISGLIARELAGKWQQHKTEEACICAMFHNLGTFMALYYLPEEHLEVLAWAKAKKTDLQRASRMVIGMSYEDLGIGIAQNWGLPDKIVKSMRSIPKNEKNLLQTNPMRAIAGLSNLLCDAAVEPDTAKRDKILARIIKDFEISNDYITGMYSDVWDKIQKYSTILNIDLNDSNILSRFATNLADQNEKAATESQNIAVMEKFYNIVTRGISDITQILLEDSYELNSILSMVMEVMYLGFGFSRVLICIADSKTKKMIARFGLGDNINAFMKNFSFEIKPSKDFVNTALHQAKGIYVQDLNAPLDELDIPDWYRNTVKAVDAMVYPIIINDKKIGLFYADREEKRVDFSADQLEYMNILCNQAALAIKQKGR